MLKILKKIPTKTKQSRIHSIKNAAVRKNVSAYSSLILIWGWNRFAITRSVKTCVKTKSVHAIIQRCLYENTPLNLMSLLNVLSINLICFIQKNYFFNKANIFFLYDSTPGWSNGFTFNKYALIIAACANHINKYP